MVAILSRIFVFTGPQINAFSLLGLFIMLLGAIVCFKAAWIVKLFTGRDLPDERILPVRLAGLLIAAAGLITVIYLKG